MLKRCQDVSPIFHALADPTRRQMVERLAAGSASTSELAAPFDMSLSAVHQHLTILREAGLVATEKQGRQRICRIDVKPLRLVERWTSDRRKAWERKLDALQTYLEPGDD